MGVVAAEVGTTIGRRKVAGREAEKERRQDRPAVSVLINRPGKTK
jgi:hypothetical protein